MCLQFHQGLSDDTVLQQMKAAIDNPQYDKWNTASLSHVFIAAVGFNGKEAQGLASQFLYNYVQWARMNRVNGMGTYFGPPDEAYAQSVLGLSVAISSKFEEEGLTRDEIRNRVLHDASVFEAMLGSLSDRSATAKPVDFLSKISNWLSPTEWWSWAKSKLSVDTHSEADTEQGPPVPTPLPDADTRQAPELV